jgi:chromosome segregation ATPase
VNIKNQFAVRCCGSQQKNAQLAEQLASATAKSEQLTKESQELKAQSQQLEKQLSTLKVQKQTAETEMAAQSGAMLKELAELKLQKKTLDEQLAGLKTATGSKEQQSLQLTQQLASATTKAEQMDGEAKALKAMSGPTASRTAAQALTSIFGFGAKETGGIQVCNLMAL